MLAIRRFISRHKTGSILVLLLCISILLILFNTHDLSFRPKEFGLSLFSVFETAFYEAGSFFKRTVTSINELKKVKSEYEDLQDKLAEYRAIERDIVELKQENKSLREQLGFSERIGYNHIAAEVTGKDPGNIFNTIMINKGSHDGIRRDMPVIAYQDGFQGLIGKVINVGLFSSAILPIFDINCYVVARLQATRYDGLVFGQGGTSNYILMKYVKKRARSEIKYGDLVITSGMTSIYPKGIYIGRVRSIGAKEYETSLELELEPIIDFSRLEYVFVLNTGG
ncbi:MAG: rod shape-determining protein MreC [Spirochaetota bacterium]